MTTNHRHPQRAKRASGISWRCPTAFGLGMTIFLAAAGCRTTARSSEALEADEGPAFTRPAWIKSPEAIEGTITQAWGLNMTSKERWKYLQSMYAMLGGTLVLNTKSLVDQPNELFVMGLDNLSTWLAGKLLDKQLETPADGLYIFEGLGFAGDDTASCFDNDAEEWCDFLDKVTPTSLSAAGVQGGSLSKAWQKRVMHNIQDIGEFMLLAIDNTLEMPGDGRHAARFLYEEVFVPNLMSGGEGPVTADAERQAWQAVVHAILMSGGFYLEAPTETAH